MASPQLHKTVGGNAAFHNFNNDFAGVQDPNERRRLALAEIDKAPFGWYHVRACVVAGVVSIPSILSIKSTTVKAVYALIKFSYCACSREYPRKFTACV